MLVSMGFLRVKKIKGKEYAYLVENSWTAKGPRQEVKKYLGRVYKFKGKSNLAINSEGSKREFLVKLIESELEGIKRQLGKEKIEFDREKLHFVKGNRNCVLGLNQGLMCDFTLGRILNFKKTGDIEVDSVKLAKFFIEAGFDVPQEAFIAYFERL